MWAADEAEMDEMEEEAEALKIRRRKSFNYASCEMDY